MQALIQVLQRQLNKSLNHLLSKTSKSTPITDASGPNLLSADLSVNTSHSLDTSAGLLLFFRSSLFENFVLLTSLLMLVLFVGVVALNVYSATILSSVTSQLNSRLAELDSKSGEEAFQALSALADKVAIHKFYFAERLEQSPLLHLLVSFEPMLDFKSIRYVQGRVVMTVLTPDTVTFSKIVRASVDSGYVSEVLLHSASLDTHGRYLLGIELVEDSSL